MNKDTTTIQIDGDVKYKLRQIGFQIGPTCNEFLRKFVNAYFKDKGAEDLHAIQDELDEIDRKVLDLNVRRAVLIESKEAIMSAVKKSEEKKIVEQETKGLCIVCHETPRRSKLHAKDGSVVCLECVTSLSKDKRKELGLA